jgi:cytoskeletal protein CcmA (bactofilin family)
MKPIQKLFSVFALLAIVTIVFATPARAFDGRSGDEIVIKADEVIDDDLYVTARTFTLEGTVNGDVVVFAQTITINGTVNGDLIAAGQVVIINGTVTDDARIAGAALQMGEKASVGSDVVGAAASLELKNGSTVKGELVYAGGQALLAGDITGDVLAATGGLELSGSFGGNVQAHVDANENTASSPPMNMYMTNIPITLPSVRPGLKVDDGAKIAGNLEYTSTVDLPVPAGVVAGKVTRTAPAPSERARPVQPTPAQQVGKWALDLLRGMITLILFGLLLGWLFPFFMRALPEEIRTHPWSSLGWGAIAWAAFFFGLLVIVLAMILGGLIFGFLTLSGVSGTIIWVGILALIGFTILFILVTSFLTKIVVGELIGKWILNRTNPALAGHNVWPMVVGVVVLVAVIGLFRFPLLPLGFFGWLINFLVILCGLGALWLWTRDRYSKPALPSV